MFETVGRSAQLTYSSRSRFPSEDQPTRSKRKATRPPQLPPRPSDLGDLGPLSLHRSHSSPTESSRFERFKGWVDSGLKATKHAFSSVYYSSTMRPHEHKFSLADVYVLGKRYSRDTSLQSVGEIELDRQEQEMRVRREIFSRVWVTYRKEFPCIEHSSYTSDRGWGCMLRSGQMLLAQALVRHYLPRDWRYDETKMQPVMYAHLIRWLVDDPTPECVFSLHALLKAAKPLYHKPVGTWYAPAETCRLLKVCLDDLNLASLACVVAHDQTLCMDQIVKACTEERVGARRLYSPYMSSSRASQSQHNVSASPQPPRSSTTPTTNPRSSIPPLSQPSASTSPPLPPVQTSTGSLEDVPLQASQESDAPPPPSQDNPGWRSVILLIPLRLGLEKLNPVYVPTIRKFLRMRQSLGIIGGKPLSSLYFVGYQDNRLFYLDPHYTRKAVSATDNLETETSYHCPWVQSLPVGDVDPSLALGFYCRTKADLDDFWRDVMQCCDDGEAPFSLAQVTPHYHLSTWNGDDEEELSSSLVQGGNANAQLPTSLEFDEGDDEFVLL